MLRTMSFSAPTSFLSRCLVRLRAHHDQLLRVALSPYVTNGLSVAMGLVLIMLLVYESAGLGGASSAAVGVLITSLPDVPSARKRKVMQMLPAPLLGAPLFMLVQLLHDDPMALGLLLVAGTFLAVMMMAWGKRGGPLTFSLLFFMLFSMAAPPATTPAQVGLHGAWFLLGAALYLLWGVLTTHLLNMRYRRQMLAETIHSFADILRTQAQRFNPGADLQALLGQMLAQQSTLADHLQATRDVVLESPTTPRRQRFAAMLVALLEARDHQLACDLDMDALRSHPQGATALPALGATLRETAAQLDALSMDLLLGRDLQRIAAVPDQRAWLSGVLPPRTPADPPKPRHRCSPTAQTPLRCCATWPIASAISTMRRCTWWP